MKAKPRIRGAMQEYVRAVGVSFFILSLFLL